MVIEYLYASFVHYSLQLIKHNHTTQCQGEPFPWSTEMLIIDF